MTSEQNQPTLTAKSPSISPPTTESEFESIAGVFIEASFNPSIASSAIKSCAIIGSAPGSAGTTNLSHSGRYMALSSARYQSGVYITDRIRIQTRKSLKYVPVKGGKL